jgi:hypothetical protein
MRKEGEREGKPPPGLGDPPWLRRPCCGREEAELHPEAREGRSVRLSGSWAPDTDRAALSRRQILNSAMPLDRRGVGDGAMFC